MPEVRKNYCPQRFCATGDIAEPQRATTESSATQNRAERRLTFGAIVGVVEPVAVHSFGESGEAWVAENFPAREKHFCNYERGRFGWVFKNPVAFETPIPCRGLQSLGTPPAEVRAQITGALRAAGEQRRQEILNNSN